MFQPGISGNPRGRPRRQHTITDLIKARLDKKDFVERLIALANGGGDTPHLVQLSAMRLILAYTDGLPLRQEEDNRGPIRLVVEYVDESPSCAVIDISGQQQLTASAEGGQDLE